MDILICEHLYICTNHTFQACKYLHIPSPVTKPALNLIAHLAYICT